jgi:signal transduction histidine kinase
MEVFRPEVHALFLCPFLDEARAIIGDQKVRDLVASFGVTEEALRDKEAWVSLEFCEAFCERLYREHADPALFDRCGRLVLTPRYLGILQPLYRAFGTPMFAYTQAAQSGPRFNKVGWMKILEQRRGYIKVEYRCLPGAPRERSELVCRTRAAQLSGIPTMFDLRAAEVRHPVCMHRGGDFCLYELAWREPAGKRLSRAGFLAGAVAGAILARLLHWPAPAAIALGGGAVAWSFGRLLELRRDLGQRAVEIHDYHDALTRSASAAEERYAQLLGTKAEVEQKVEERTARLREAGQRLEAALREMQALKEAERTFFANVSHDLRTPLTLILAPLGEVLSRGDLAEETRRALEIIRNNAGELRKLIDQLLEMEKIEAGRAEVVRAPADPVALLRGLAERFSAAASTEGIALEVDTPAQVAPLALDSFSVESALSNLAANALRFARSRIALRLAEREGAVVFEVRDDGEGIAPEDLPRIFDRFAQAGDSAKRKSGTGLGLALAREAARLHGGTLTAASTPGAGATFTLALPRVAPPDEAPDAPEARPASGAAAPAAPAAPAPVAAVARAPASFAGPDPHAPLVLVVEDDDDLRRFVGEVLSSHYRVATARDGAEGLEIALRARPDAVVSDLAMPRMDGLELCRQIRAREQGKGAPRTPVVLLTARAQLSRVLEGFEAGADDYVTKPFHAPELLARVGVHVLLGKLLKEIAHKERLATLGLVAASVAHQVRNPLSALQNTVESLKERVEGGPRIAGMFDLIDECAGRIEKLTNDLLDLSRVDREEPARFRPADGIEACVRVVSARLPAETRILTELDGDLEIEGRPGDLNHVFLNLIDNAARAVGGRGTVVVRTARAGEHFVLEVADSGPGVPEQERHAIFEPFYSTRAAGEGTGLGLFLVKKVVGAHGGSVSVGRSELGGASFLIRIPGTPPAGAGSSAPAAGQQG